MKEYNPVVYNFRLWITADKNRLDILDEFYDYYTDENLIDVSERDVVFPVVRKDNGAYGVLITFYGKSRICMKTVAHEVIHATAYLMAIIGDKINGDEKTAYIAGWIAECCEDIKKVK